MKRIAVLPVCALLLLLCACGHVAPELTTAPPTTIEETTIPQEEIESIYHVITSKIHPDLPEFTFALIGDWTRVFPRKWGGEIVYDASNMRESTNIREIRVEAEGSFFQWLDGFATCQRMEIENYGLELQDFNNDGYLDIALYYSAGAVDPIHLFWLWDKGQEKFVRNEQLQEINADWQFFQLEDDGRIKVFSRSGGGIEWGIAWYEYRNGAFVLVESEDGKILFEEEGGESVPVGKHIVIKKLINGKLQTVSDTREKVEEN